MEDRVFGRRYRLTEKIGAGGMAEVYKAVDETLGRTVAVKVLHRQYSTDPSFVARFRQEAASAANLSHPSIVNIYDWGKDDDTYYIVMEYVRGTDLKTLLDEHGPLDPIKAAEYAVQVCSALAVAHGYDVIHRDIKPHNMVLMPDGNLKVMDFGIARAGDSTMTQTGSVLGTAQYISPEQAQGRPLGPPSDLYSLGVTLYELTTGRLPFTADTPVAVALKQVNEQPVPPRRIRPEIPAALEAVIMRAMQKDPAARYRSAEEMRDDLKRVIAGLGVAPVAPAVPSRADDTAVISAVEREERLASVRPRQTQPPRRRGIPPWVWILVALGLLLAGGLAAWGMGLFEPRTVAVPDVANVTEATATQRIRNADLTVGDVTTANSDTVPRGRVISQKPPANVPVARGTAVSFVLSVGVEERAVPDLTGLTQSEAVQLIQEKGLVVGGINAEANSKVAEGKVIRQDPDPQTSVTKATPVTIWVSSGPERVAVPEVTGSSVDAALRQINAKGLKAVVRERFDSAAKGAVIDQNPSAGVEVNVGTTVTLIVSKGQETVTVPDVTQMQEQAAKSKLEALGLVVTVTLTDASDPADVGVVMTQDPQKDAVVNKGTTVEIVVGRTPEGP